MSRRFQFSLRALLGTATIVGLLLGGWRLLDTYGNRLDVEKIRIGAPVKVTARYVSPFGPAECNLMVGLKSADGSDVGQSILVERSWLCLYRADLEIDPIDHPCQVVVYSRWHETLNRGGRMRALKENTVDVK